MGVFDGNDHIIANMTINTDSVINVGLFGELDGAAVVRNLGLTGVSVTVTNDFAVNISVGGLAGVNRGNVSDSYAKGQITVTRREAFSASDVGGLVGSNVAVDVTVSEGSSYAGGFVGDNSGAIAASYATGDVSATASENEDAIAGGLVGNSAGTVMASYATGDVAATAPGTNGVATAGGLVGIGNGVITPSYSTGGVTATADADGTATQGGLKGSGNDNAVASYWDADTSGIATTTANNAGKGMSTVALQFPTGYGTTTDIFGEWNLALDPTTTTPQDPWDFGDDWQYPVLKYGGLKAADQRAQVTLVQSATSTLEDATVTVKATLDKPSKLKTEVTLTVSEGASADKATLTIPAGKTESNTATITPADDNDVGKTTTSPCPARCRAAAAARTTRPT